eukprot:g1760.t1
MQNGGSSSSFANAGCSHSLFNDEWQQHVAAVCFNPESEYEHAGTGEIRHVTLPWHAESHRYQHASAPSSGFEAPRDKANSRINRYDNDLFARPDPTCSLEPDILAPVCGFARIRDLVDEEEVDKLFPEPPSPDPRPQQPDILRPDFDPEAAGAPCEMVMMDDGARLSPPRRNRREVEVINGVPQPRFSSPKFFESDDEVVVDDGAAGYKWMQRLLKENAGQAGYSVSIDLLKVTSFSDVRELLERHAPYGSKCMNVKGNKKGIRNRVVVPSMKALQNSFKLLLNVPPGDPTQKRTWLRPTSMQFRVFARYCLSTRVEVDLPKIDKDEEEFMKKTIAGVKYLNPAAGKAMELDKKRRRNWVWAEFGRHYDSDLLHTLPTHAEKRKCLEYIIATSTATSIAKMQLLQKYFGIIEPATQRSRFITLQEEELPLEAAARVYEPGLEFQGQKKDLEPETKRRRLLVLGDNQSAGEAKEEVAAMIENRDRRSGALKKTSVRLEFKGRRLAQLKQRVSVSAIADLDIVEDPTSQFSWKAPDGTICRTTVAQVLATEKLRELARSMSTGLQPPAIPKPKAERPFLVIRLGQDNTDYFSGHMGACEAIVMRRYKGKTYLVPVLPPPGTSDGGGDNLLMDLYDRLGTTIPLPGSLVDDWKSDPVVCLIPSTDTGGDELKMVRKLRDLANACNKVRKSPHLLAAEKPLEMYVLSLCCQYHQNSLADGETVDMVEELWQHWVKNVNGLDGAETVADIDRSKQKDNSAPAGNPSKGFCSTVNAVVRAVNMWDQARKSKVPMYCASRWGTMNTTLQRLSDDKYVIKGAVDEVVEKSRKPELQPLARAAKAAVSSEVFWQMVESALCATEPTRELSSRLKLEGKLLLSNIRIGEMMALTNSPATNDHLFGVLQNHLLVFPNDISAFLLIVNTFQRLPLRYKQYYTLPLLCRHLFSPNQFQRRQIASDLLSLPYDAHGAFSLMIMNEHGGDIQRIAERGCDVSRELGEKLRPVVTLSQPASDYMEAIFSFVQHIRKSCPNMRQEAAGIKASICKDVGGAIESFEEWTHFDELWSTLYDRRRRPADAYSQQGLMRNHHANLLGEQEHDTKSGLRPDLERAQDYADLHQIQDTERDKFGGSIQQHGKIWMPPNFTLPVGAPQARKKRHAGRSTGIMRSFSLPMGSLIKHKNDPMTRFLFRASSRKAWLLPALPFQALRQGMGLVAGETTPSPNVEEYVVDLSGKPQTLSSWATRLVQRDTNPRAKNFIFNVSTAISHRKDGFIHPMPTVPFVKLTMTTKSWVRKTIPIEEIVCEKKPAGGARTRRAVEWSSYNQVAAVPEFRHKKLSECYAIFRPEQATWQIRIPARLRGKADAAQSSSSAAASSSAAGVAHHESESEGEEEVLSSVGGVEELCKCFGRTATGRVLCQKNVMKARRRTIADCCKYMAIAVPVISAAEEKKSWEVIRAYIQATEKFNRYVEESSDSDEDDLED